VTVPPQSEILAEGCCGGSNPMTIESIHNERIGKVSDKWSSYLSYYDKLFAPIKDLEVSLFEIGIQNGGSLETWSTYFQNGKVFVGCDINPKCGELRFDDNRIKIIVGDANTKESYDALKRLEPAFDIIIDDGSHVSHDIIASFVQYFPLLKPGGIYIVEDTHTLYMKGFFGGLLNATCAQSFFYKLADVLNFEFWGTEIPLDAHLQTFFADGSVPSFIREGWVDSVSFRNSLITIQKADSPTHSKLGKRIVAGKSTLVDSGPSTYQKPRWHWLIR
jgi:hypothetical protein